MRKIHHFSKGGLLGARLVGQTLIGDMGDGDWVSDMILFPRPPRLASGDALVHGGAHPRRPRLLRGEGNHLAWNGIDEWVGGVHLDSRAGRVWTFDGERVARWRG